MNRTLVYFIFIILFSCQEENKPPTCIIISPSNNSSFNIGDTILIEGLAVDPEGKLEEISLNLNGTLLAALDTSTFQYELITDSYQPDNYTLQAIAKDGGGLEDSDEIQITINATIPTVISGAIDSITITSAIISGEVSADGGSTVTTKGVCWSTLENPSLSGKHTVEGIGTGTFESKITGLLCSTQYFARAYATNEQGTSYGEQVSFTTDNCYSLPTVTTISVSEIKYSSAVCGGNVTDNGGAHIKERGICWSTFQNPTILDDKTSNGSGIGSFESFITGLSNFTTYYVRAYATNNVGTAYGGQISFKSSSVTDYDGNVYRLIQIGSQLWIGENLKVSHYLDGTSIPHVQSNTDWSTSTYGSYCFYSNDPSNGEIYGALYNWPAVITDKLCPSGWHVPSDSEWTILTDFLGGVDIAGGKLKESGTTHW